MMNSVLPPDRVRSAPVPGLPGQPYARIESVLVGRRLPGDEHEVVAGDRRHEKRASRDRRVLRIELSDFVVLPRDYGDHRHRDVRVALEQTLHQHRRGRGNVVAELAVSRELIGAHRLEHRVVLVYAHAVTEVGAERGEGLAHALQDELGLAPEPRRAKGGEALRTFHFRRRACGEVERLVAGEEEPLPGLHRVGVGNRASCEPLDGMDFDRVQRSRGGQSLTNPSRLGIFN